MFKGGNNNYFKAIKKLLQRFYAVIFIVVILLVSMNYKVLIENVVEDKQNIVSSYLALVLTMGIFVLFAVPIMSIYTRKKCPNCGKYLLRNINQCYHCDHELRRGRDTIE